jgi:hypothetical protein
MPFLIIPINSFTKSRYTSAQTSLNDSSIIQPDNVTAANETNANATTFFAPFLGSISSGISNNISSSLPILNTTYSLTTGPPESTAGARINQSDELDSAIPCSFIRPEDIPVSPSEADKVRFIANRQINEKYEQFSSTLGQPLSDQLVAINAQDPLVKAYYKEYQNGIIAWSEKHCAQEMDREIADKWKTSSPFPHTSSTVQVPVTDTLATGGRAGKINLFSQNYALTSINPPVSAAIVWTPSIGAYIVSGTAFSKWLEYGRETGVLGYPTSDVISTNLPGGGDANYIQRFQNGVVISARANNAIGDFVVYGPIYDKWAATRAQNGPLQYPTLDTRKTAGELGLFGYFMAGSSSFPGDGAIYWSQETGAHFIYGDVLFKYEGLGWESSCLGYPTSDQERVNNNPNVNSIARFQRGSITWYSTGAGAVSTCGDICPPDQHRDTSTGFCVQNASPPPRCPNGSNQVAGGKCATTGQMGLQKNTPYSGNIYYVGLFPAVGVVNDGTLTKIQNDRTNNAYVYIIKQGYTSEQCNKPNAVVALAPGQSTENIMSITSNPRLPIYVAACIFTTGTVPDSITLTIGFTFKPR